jgi:hypothetical protein
MSSTGTWQVHANVNTDHNDSALRVTITFYDEAGYEVHTKTWRKHVKGLLLDSSEWQAYAAITELARMMAFFCETEHKPTEIDEPLF